MSEDAAQRTQQGPETPPRYAVKWTRFVEQYEGESDRAVVILRAAKIDFLLCQILRKQLSSEPTGRDPLLDGDGPLSTLSARILLLHRLSIIDDDFARALQLIRRIRNAFAHEVSGCNLSLGGHRDRVRELFDPFADLVSSRWIRRIVSKEELSPSADFRVALSMIVGRLESIYESLRRPSQGSREPLVTERMKTLTDSELSEAIRQASTSPD